MKMAPIPPLRSRFAALAPANLLDTLNRHSRIVNIIALLIILLVVADLAGWTAPLERFFTRHSVWTVGRIDRPLAHCPVHFVTAMVSDGQGGAWVAGEDSGIYHYQPGWPAHWQHYDKGNSPGLISNHIYSLCLDARGRLWAGTLRHGVCVFNGARWVWQFFRAGPNCYVMWRFSSIAATDCSVPWLLKPSRPPHCPHPIACPIRARDQTAHGTGFPSGHCRSAIPWR